MRVYRNITEAGLRRIASVAPAMEAAGYDGLLSTELRHDPFLPLGVAALHTSRIALATGIAVAFARSPMAVANLAWDLNDISGGRFALGLGTQIRAHNEKRFSAPWSPPAPRMREYIRALRAIWRCWQYGEKLAFEGEHYRFTLMTPEFTPEPSEADPPAITLAAVGPAMMRVAAEEADGARLHGFCTAKYARETILPRIEAGLAASGRKRGNFEVSGGGFVATGPDDEAVARARETMRYRVGFYGSTPAYWPVLETHGLGDLGRKLNAMTKAGQWDRLAAEISDDVLELFCVSARHDGIAAGIEARFGGLSDVLSTGLNEDFPPDLLQDLRRVRTPFEGFETGRAA